jgi:hypothetical protein
MTSSASAAVGPPPLHIPLIPEYPCNPHGGAPPPDAPLGGDGSDFAADACDFRSDSDDWALDASDAVGEAVDEASLAAPLQITAAKDVPPGIWPGWRCAVVCDERLYFPQLGDDVAVMWAAYKTQKVHGEAGSVPRGSSEVVSAIVTGIKFGENDMKVRMLPQGSDTTCSVTYRFPPSQHYILEEVTFQNCLAIAKNLKRGDRIVTLAFAPEGEVQLTRLKVLDLRKGAMFGSILGEDEQGMKRECSPWDLFAVNGMLIERSRDRDEMKTFLTSCQKLIEGLIADPQFEGFVSVPATPEYRGKVTFPMSLSIMSERLEMQYYRTLDAIRGDADQILANTKDVYGEAGPETAAAKHLKERVLHNLRLMNKKRKR